MPEKADILISEPMGNHMHLLFIFYFILVDGDSYLLMLHLLVLHLNLSMTWPVYLFFNTNFCLKGSFIGNEFCRTKDEKFWIC